MEATRHDAPLAVLFPGQGSQTPDMREQVERWRPDLVLLARAAVGDDPFERADESTRYAQPAIFCAALAGWRRLRNVVEPAAMAGHSLGEISALVAAGALSAEDGLHVVAARGRLMEHAAEANGPGGMLAVRTTEHAELAALAGDAGLVVANENAPEQAVLSGPSDALGRVERVLGARGIRTKRLPIRGAFHTPAMAPAVPRFREVLAGVRFGAPAVPVLSCVTGREFDDVRERLAEALVKPVRWLDVMRTLRARGITRFVESGPGHVLTGLVRRTLADVEAEPAAPILEAAHAHAHA
jgi:[acyl-carrier-protein] S-malonyltransferase